MQYFAETYGTCTRYSKTEYGCCRNQVNRSLEFRRRSVFSNQQWVFCNSRFRFQGNVEDNYTSESTCNVICTDLPRLCLFFPSSFLIIHPLLNYIFLLFIFSSFYYCLPYFFHSLPSSFYNPLSLLHAHHPPSFSSSFSSFLAPLRLIVLLHHSSDPHSCTPGSERVEQKNNIKYDIYFQAKIRSLSIHSKTGLSHICK